MSSSNAPPLKFSNSDRKIPREYAFLFMIAAKAAVLDVPNWQEALADGWWSTEGKKWITTLSERLEKPLDELPETPSPTDVGRFAFTIPAEEHHAAVLSLLSVCLLPVTTGANPSQSAEIPLNYTATTRAFLSKALSFLRIAPEHLLAAEDHVAQGLYQSLKTVEIEKARKEQEQGWGGRWGRLAATVGGVIVGGVALGLTSGLAAPALLPLVPFLTASSAPVVLGTLFGLTGGGLAGLRVNKRWAGVDKFEFVQIVGGGEHEDPGSVVRKEGSVDKPQAPSLVATIIVPGILLKSETEVIDNLRLCAWMFSAPRRDTFVLQHSPETMLQTGKALESWIKGQLLGKLKSEIIKRTALQAVFSVVALPISVYKTTGMVVDNDWQRGCDRAKKAGRLLADVLKDKVQGDRPVVLIGSSLGALVILEALQILGESKSSTPLVDSAVFVSLAAAPSSSEWQAVRRVVGRRVVNAYCTTDLVLAGVGRLHEALDGLVHGMAGLGEVSEQGVENINISNIIDGMI